MGKSLDAVMGRDWIKALCAHGTFLFFAHFSGGSVTVIASMLFHLDLLCAHQLCVKMRTLGLGVSVPRGSHWCSHLGGGSRLNMQISTRKDDD